MTEEENKLGGNISLINFGILEPSEIITVKKIVGAYIKKISEKTSYKGIKLRLKQNEHGTSFIHKIDAEAVISASQSKNEGKDTILSASSSGRNLFSVLSEVLEKINSEADHRVRSTKQVGAEMKRKQKNSMQKEKTDDIEI